MLELTIDSEPESREFRRLFVVSSAVHAALFLVLIWTPRPASVALPGVISVELVALPALPAPPAKAAREAVPLPAPRPPEPPPPPAPKKVLLPAKPQKEVEERVRKPRKRVQKRYEDVMAQLRAELGEERPTQTAETLSPAPAEGSDGGLVSPEVQAWIRDTRMHVRRGWVVPADYREQALVTLVRVHVDASGRVIGTPRVERSSGDPFWDDNVIRAIERASPLPAPPAEGAGEWPFVFRSDEQ